MIDPVRQARPCSNCGAPRAEDATDEIDLCAKCLGIPTEPSTPVPATQEGDSRSELERQTAEYIRQPTLASQSGSFPAGHSHSQFDPITDAIHLAFGSQSVNVSLEDTRSQSRVRARVPTPESIPVTDTLQSTLGFQPVNVSQSGGRPKGKERAVDPSPELVSTSQSEKVSESNSAKVTTGVGESQSPSVPEARNILFSLMKASYTDAYPT
jgi:hypothetical protein